MKKTMATVGKVAKSTLLVQPIRILIIINSIFLPLLLGILIFIILKYAQEIEDIIDKAKKIEGMVEDNINLGINKIKEIYAQTSDAAQFAQSQLTVDNTKTFIKDHLLTPILEYIDPTIEVTNDILENITKIPDMNFTSLLDVSGHSINDILLLIKPELITQGYQEALINKVLGEDRSIAYVLTHGIMNGGGQI